MLRSRRASALAVVLAHLVLAPLVVACGDDDTGADQGATSGGGAPPASVTVSDFDFDPTELTVGAGATIEIDNRGDAAHTLTADDESFDSGSIAGGESTSITAPEGSGDYGFFCEFHPFMKGTLTVE